MTYQEEEALFSVGVVPTTLYCGDTWASKLCLISVESTALWTALQNDGSLVTN